MEEYRADNEAEGDNLDDQVPEDELLKFDELPAQKVRGQNLVWNICEVFASGMVFTFILIPLDMILLLHIKTGTHQLSLLSNHDI
jgi:hypothetical protein